LLAAASAAPPRAAPRLEAATGPADPGVASTWPLFTHFWRIQDNAEKRALWTVMYAEAAGEREHGRGRVGVVLESLAVRALRVVPLIDAVDAALEHRDRPAFTRHARELRTSLDVVLDFKEADVLPLIQETLTPFEWGTFDVEFRQELGLRGLGTFLPWLLDDASESTRGAVLRLLPPPVRLFYKAARRPRHRRRGHPAVPAC
jgi:hypothetical protein